MINIGVLGKSKFALNKIIPAIENNTDVAIVAIASASDDERSLIIGSKVKSLNKDFVEKSLILFDSFSDLINSDFIHAVYIPLPPKLHFFWAKFCLENGKHVIIEKPAVLKTEDALELVDIARKNNLALIENFAFIDHKQTRKMFELLDANMIGNIRLIKASFGYPFRGVSDHRYSKEYGGGALNDAGCYTIKIIRAILGSDVDILSARLIPSVNNEIDDFGAGMLIKEGIISQISFGINNQYECKLEIWGTKGIINMPRIFTAPMGFNAVVKVSTQNNEIDFELNDNQFSNFFTRFSKLLLSEHLRELEYIEIIEQSKLMHKFRLMGLNTILNE